MNKSRNEIDSNWLKENPCYQCNRRTAKCHGICEDYAKSKEIKSKIKEKIKMQKMLDEDYMKIILRDYHGKLY